jgi:hypothetical protein
METEYDRIKAQTPMVFKTMRDHFSVLAGELKTKSLDSTALSFCVNVENVRNTLKEVKKPSKERIVWRGRWSQSTFRKLKEVELPENIECMKILLRQHYRFTLHDEGHFTFYWPNYSKSCEGTCTPIICI